MSFWKNPENNSLKVIIIVVIIAIAGAFAYKAMHKDALTEKGSVIDPGSLGGGTDLGGGHGAQTMTFSATTVGRICTINICEGTQCAGVNGIISPDNATCGLTTTQPNPTALGLLKAINPGVSGSAVTAIDFMNYPAGTTCFFRIQNTQLTGTKMAGPVCSVNISASSILGNIKTYFTQLAAPALPQVSTTMADTSSGVSVVLKGQVTTTGNSAVTVGFDYGPTISYGKHVSGGIMTAPGTFSSSALKLTPRGAPYHYRVTATNATGTVYGRDSVFVLP